MLSPVYRLGLHLTDIFFVLLYVQSSDVLYYKDIA
jgi:hypothetical protein